MGQRGRVGEDLSARRVGRPDRVAGGVVLQPGRLEAGPVDVVVRLGGGKARAGQRLGRGGHARDAGWHGVGEGDVAAVEADAREALSAPVEEGLHEGEVEGCAGGFAGEDNVGCGGWGVEGGRGGR